MKIYSVKCNNCAADLEITDSARFVTCTFCGSSLVIERTGNSLFTQLAGDVNDIKGQTSELLKNSELLLVEKEIERLDRSYQALPESTRSAAENPGATIFGGIIMIVIAIAMIVTVNQKVKEFNSFGLKTDVSSGPPFIFFFFIIIAIGVIIYRIFSSFSASSERDIYKRRRQELIEKLKKLQ